MRIALRTKALDTRVGAAPDGLAGQGHEPGDAIVPFDVAIQLRRRGVETRLVIARDTSPARKPDPRLVAAVAQGHSWFADLRDRKVASVLGLAERHRMHHRDVSRILPLGLLAPDIVEAILAGSQPTDLTVSRLKRLSDLPVLWDQQRRILGFD